MAHKKFAKKLSLLVAVCALVVLGALLVTAVNDRAKINQFQAQQIALSQVQGEVQEVELETEGGVEVYEVDVETADGEVEVEIDPYTQEILAVEEDEEDTPITGTPLERASAAALAYIGEGRVTDSEIGDEEGYYEIEITTDDGDEVDVHLDENFNVLSVEWD